MAESSAEHESWPPDSLLMTAQEIVWSQYVGGVVLPAADIWKNMTTYLQEQPPESFVLYHSTPQVKTRWQIEQTARHEPTGRTMEIAAAIKTETPTSSLGGLPDFDAGLERLTALDQEPDPRWPSYHRKVSIPAQEVLRDHPGFLLHIASACDVIDVQLKAEPSDEYRALGMGTMSKECYTRLVSGHDLETRPSEESPMFFRPQTGLVNLRSKLRERTAANNLTLPQSDIDATQTTVEEVLRNSLPWRVGANFRELEAIHLALTGQLHEAPRL